MSKHIFISYMRENETEATRLAALLRGYGLEIWLDRDRIKPGTFWQDAIRDAIHTGSFFIALFSEEYAARVKTYMNEELLLALGELRLRPTHQAWFIPVVLSGEVPDIPLWPGRSLRDIQWVSLKDNIVGRENWNTLVSSIIAVVEPSLLGHKSQRRAALEHKVYDRMYHFEAATAPALRLVGAGTEYFKVSDVSVVTRNEPYLIPLKYRSRHKELRAKLEEEAASKHKMMFDGPACRMLGYQISISDPATEKKALRLVLGPLGYFDYAIVRRLSDAAMEDGGVDQLDEFVDVEGIAAGKDLSSSSLSNIVDTSTTIVTSDGYLLFVVRSNQVSDRDSWHTSAVAENINAVKDSVDFSAKGETFGLPFWTAARGLSEELSPKLKEILFAVGWERHLRLLGMYYDLEGFHPGFIFLLTLPRTHNEVRKICREFPGEDGPIEGALDSISLSSGTDDIVQKLATTQWTPGGAASVIRSLEYLSSVATERRLGSLQEAVNWNLRESGRH